ncbi:hypothetical protein, partial [Oricola indica]|uniref:hypothetical protein n=1 Tax=Oricola indica TaxID=2872591 RepID=UPI001CBB47EA
ILVRRLAHDAPSYSGVGASGKPGAVQAERRSPIVTGLGLSMERALQCVERYLCRAFNDLLESIIDGWL